MSTRRTRPLLLPLSKLSIAQEKRSPGTWGSVIFKLLFLELKVVTTNAVRKSPSLWTQPAATASSGGSLWSSFLEYGSLLPWLFLLCSVWPRALLSNRLFDADSAGVAASSKPVRLQTMLFSMLSRLNFTLLFWLQSTRAFIRTLKRPIWTTLRHHINLRPLRNRTPSRRR